MGEGQCPHRDRHAEDSRVERQGEFLFERRVEPDGLLGRSVGVDDRLFDQIVETA